MKNCWISMTGEKCQISMLIILLLFFRFKSGVRSQTMSLSVGSHSTAPPPPLPECIHDGAPVSNAFILQALLR